MTTRSRTDRRSFRAALRYLVRRRPSGVVLATPARIRADILAAETAHAEAIDQAPELQRLVAELHASCDLLESITADMRAQRLRLDAIDSDTTAVAEAVGLLDAGRPDLVVSPS